MDLHLAGRAVVVTGASKGIGLATARRFADEGARVLGVARTITLELEATAERVLSADLSVPSGAAAVAEAVAGWAPDGVDVLVNNAGGVAGAAAAPGGFATIDDDAWRRTLDLNLLSAVRVTRALVDGLLRRRGVIVNVSSLGARIAAPGLDYGVAKAGLTNLTKALSEEYAPQGMRAVTVTPGPTRTTLLTGPDGPVAAFARSIGVDHDEVLAGVPSQMGQSTGRLAEPEETAATIAFLASPLAGSITGADVLVDGGALKTV